MVLHTRVLPTYALVYRVGNTATRGKVGDSGVYQKRQTQIGAT